MLLGLSGLNVDGEIDPSALADGAGVPHGKLLVDFVNATVFAVDADAGDQSLSAARDAVADAIGPEALIDVAAVVGNFTMMTRIADGTGTPLDAGTVDVSEQIRADLGLDELTSRRGA